MREQIPIILVVILFSLALYSGVEMADAIMAFTLMAIIYALYVGYIRRYEIFPMLFTKENKYD